jgi:hypothetical protein
MEIIDEEGEEKGRIKAIQKEKSTVEHAERGEEVAVSVPGLTFDRQLKSVKFLYPDLTAEQFRNFKKNKDLLSQDEIKTLQEIAEIKRKDKAIWGI